MSWSEVESLFFLIAKTICRCGQHEERDVHVLDLAIRFPRGSIILNSARAKGREVGTVPTATERFNKEHARFHTSPEYVDSVSLI